jgi:hypothetical protein
VGQLRARGELTRGNLVSWVEVRPLCDAGLRSTGGVV